MILLFRLFVVLVQSLFRSRTKPLESSSITLRVYPTDIDINFHMNNGRYLSLMDLGRLDFIARNGILRESIRRHWYPVVGSATIRFIRSLGPFATYKLETELLGWDEKWFYLRQRFVWKGNLMAVGVVKGLFLGPGRKIAPHEVLAMVGYTGESPRLPHEVITWQASEASLVNGA